MRLFLSSSFLFISFTIESSHWSQKIKYYDHDPRVLYAAAVWETRIPFTIIVTFFFNWRNTTTISLTMVTSQWGKYWRWPMIIVFFRDSRSLLLLMMISRWSYLYIFFGWKTFTFRTSRTDFVVEVIHWGIWRHCKWH